MDHDNAKRLMTCYMSIGNALNDATHAVSFLRDIEEQRRIRRALGGIMLDIDRELMRPIIRRFPDLDPDS